MSSTATFPLTPIDASHGESIFITAWLVEGEIDLEAFRSALTRLTNKWRLLAGRLQSYEGLGKNWRIIIPLGPLRPKYQTFTLTISTSEHAAFEPHESLPTVSPSPPLNLLIDPGTPRCNQDWERTQDPLTCWHITRLRADPTTGKSRTAISFSRPHGVLDAAGAAQIVHALTSEMNGQEWTVPTPPKPGMNENPVQKVLDEQEKSGTVALVSFAGYSDIGIFGVFKSALNVTRKKLFQNLGIHCVILNKAILEYLVQDVRVALAKEGKEEPRVSTGDILTAWLWKANEDDNLTINCTNLASYRHLLPDTPEIQNYPHNAFTPLPYPLYTAADLREFPLPALAHQLMFCRKSLSMFHVLSAQHVFKTALVSAPIHPDADETFFLSNVSSTRILEADWTGVGASRTVCGYRYSLMPRGSPFSNAVLISGRLPDGSVVLDVTLSRARLRSVETELKRLSEVVGVPYVSMK
ncbi:hypothetical protein CPB85DRAFT_1225696 [Mucidula mucida]|nr:hypothetical protein CPB85DRAFT_1225696 [Mucidula mucida]